MQALTLHIGDDDVSASNSYSNYRITMATISTSYSVSAEHPLLPPPSITVDIYIPFNDKFSESNDNGGISDDDVSREISSSPYIINLASAMLNSLTPQQALRIFNSASGNVNPTKTLKLHSAIVCFLSQAKLYMKARCLIEDLVKILRNTRRPQKASSSISNALNQVQTSGSNPNMLGALIGALCEKDISDEGYGVYNKMGKLIAVQACNMLLKGILKTGHVKFMWEVYDNMVLKGLSPSEVTYGVLTDASCEKRDIERARSLFEEMIEKGLKSTVVIYPTLMWGLCAMMANVEKTPKFYYKTLDLGVLSNYVTLVSLSICFAKWVRLWLLGAILL